MQRFRNSKLLVDIRFIDRLDIHQDTYNRRQNLMNLVNEESLKEEHRRQNGKKATGTDGVTKESYGQQLEKNIEDLVSRMKRFSYKPQAVRRAYIPKTNGKMRPLGIPAYEDKLVQGVMSKILNEVYEVRFLDSSCGFRPGRNAHQVVRCVRMALRARLFQRQQRQSFRPWAEMFFRPRVRSGFA